MKRKPVTSYSARKGKLVGISEKVINILKIVNLLEQKRYPDIRTLAEECEVSERSIYRYLNIINTVVTVVFDRERGGYRFEPPDARKLIPFDTSELALLAALTEFTSQLGSPLKETFQGIMNKFATIKETATSYHIMYTPLSVSIDTELFEYISKAIENSNRIRIQYHAINTDELTKRKVDPYGLFFYDGIWFLYTYCHLKNDFRWFALDRIKNLRVLKERFKKPDEIDMGKMLRHAFRFWQEDRGKETVRVRFQKPVSEIIKRKSSWHPTEKRKILPTGEVELRFELSSTKELKWWIYSWLPYVQVIEPESLREEMKKELRAALKRI